MLKKKSIDRNKYLEFETKHKIPLTKKYAKERYRKYSMETIGREYDDIDTYSEMDLFRLPESQMIVNVFTYYREKMDGRKDEEIFLALEKYRAQWDDKPYKKPMPNSLTLHSYIIYRTELELEELELQIGSLGITIPFIEHVINETSKFIENNYSE